VRQEFGGGERAVTRSVAEAQFAAQVAALEFQLAASDGDGNGAHSGRYF